MEFWLAVLGLVGFAIGYSIPLSWLMIALVCFILLLLWIKDDFGKMIIGGLGIYLFLGMALGNGYAYWQSEHEIVNQAPVHYHIDSPEENFKIIDGIKYVKAQDISETTAPTERKQEKSTWESLKTWKPFEQEKLEGIE